MLVVEHCASEVDNLLQVISKAGFDGISVPGSLVSSGALDSFAGGVILVGSLVAGDDLASGLAAFVQLAPAFPIVVLTDPEDGTKASSGFLHAKARDAISVGVAGCLPRTSLTSDLEWTLRTIAGTTQPSAALSNSHVFCYTFDNAPELLPIIIAHVRNRLESWPILDSMDPVRMMVALSEALDNALYHGNLELSSDLRQGDGRAWREESQRRLQCPPYCERRIRFQGVIDCHSARFSIRDEGPGFDPECLGDCTNQENLERCSGRGLLLMRTYMDEVCFNESGNEAILIKHHPGRQS